MIPVLAIVGRPNVGKSTLFNQLTRSRDALVLDLPGVTRDRIYGEGKVGDQPFIVIDTGGLYDESAGGGAEGKTSNKKVSAKTTHTEVAKLMAEQSWQAVKEADVVLFMVNAREGITPNDYTIANELRKISKTKKNIEKEIDKDTRYDLDENTEKYNEKNIYLVVNKMDGLDHQSALTDFFDLGFDPIPISASHAQGIEELIEQSLASFVLPSDAEETLEMEAIDELEMEAIDETEETGEIEEAKKSWKTAKRNATAKSQRH